ncbi:olfactory receptor 1F1-like [Pleurodeles waltl]|uniref:olfactory receptor 1F1-like n=1 Tax=Pleurodeles waltl TaxID=8319 RepID=UPI0037094361
MDSSNSTSFDKFLIVGFSNFPEIQVPIFVFFVLVYLTTLTGNLLIMLIIYSNPCLHTPMYVFLTNLSFTDICCTSIIFPKMLAEFFLEGNYISLNQCLLQIYFFGSMISTEFLLLAVMAYDRYVAICHPLRYTTIMNETVCICLSITCWVVSLLDPIPHIALISQLSFCGSHTINHFFCDVTALMKLSCSSTSTIESLSYIIGAVLCVMSLILIITSYLKIISVILKINSTVGRRKAFSTCSSHITVVILFSGSLSSTYIRPTSSYSIEDSKMLSLLYIVVTPLCNPIIYSLNNTELKNALKKKKNTA